MIEKVDQESEEYLKWKRGSVPIEESQEPIEPEQPVAESPEPKRSKIFFMDWFFGIETHKGQMKMMYYSFTFFFYYLFCVYMTYLIELSNKSNLNISEILYCFLLAIPVAIALPVVLLVAGFTVSGGIFVGLFVGIFSWLFGILGKFLYKIFGFDMNTLFPEFIGKRGEITKRSLLSRISYYPFTATMSDMGLPGESLLYKNNFSVRSDDELQIGMEVEIIQHEKRSITSWIKNHPTFVVRAIDDKITLNKEEI
tara:strand:- start:265 stop:1026 length:762 start_codon:yes stop_codon:yes gene_type:complete